MPTQRAWSALNDDQKEIVLSCEHAHYQWVNQHDIGTVFAAKCEHMCRPSGEPHVVCAQCLKV